MQVVPRAVMLATDLRDVDGGQDAEDGIEAEVYQGVEEGLAILAAFRGSPGHKTARMGKHRRHKQSRERLPK